MSSIASTVLPPATIEYAVHVRRGESLISRTESTESLPDARGILAALRASYPDSVLVVRAFPSVEWEPITDEELHQFTYQHAASVLGDLIAEGLPRLAWTLYPATAYDEPNLVASVDFGDDGDRREVVTRYAELLAVDPVEQGKARSTYVSVCGTYRGVSVRVYAYVDAEKSVAVA